MHCLILWIPCFLGKHAQGVALSVQIKDFDLTCAGARVCIPFLLQREKFEIYVYFFKSAQFSFSYKKNKQAVIHTKAVQIHDATKPGILSWACFCVALTQMRSLHLFEMSGNFAVLMSHPLLLNLNQESVQAGKLLCSRSRTVMGLSSIIMKVIL